LVQSKIRRRWGKAALNKKKLLKGRSMKRIVLRAIKEKLMRVIYPHERAERNKNQLVGEKEGDASQSRRQL
jgi:hypothetical protein